MSYYYLLIKQFHLLITEWYFLIICCFGYDTLVYCRNCHPHLIKLPAGKLQSIIFIKSKNSFFFKRLWKKFQWEFRHTNIYRRQREKRDFIGVVCSVSPVLANKHQSESRQLLLDRRNFYGCFNGIGSRPNVGREMVGHRK